MESVSRSFSRLKDCPCPLLKPEYWHGNGVLLLLLELTCQGRKVLVQLMPSQEIDEWGGLLHIQANGGWSQPHSNGQLCSTLLLHPLNPPNCRHWLHIMLHPTTKDIITTALCHQIKLVFFTSMTSHFLEVGRSITDSLHCVPPSHLPPSPCGTEGKPVVPDWEAGDNHLQGSPQPSHNDTRMD